MDSVEEDVSARVLLRNVLHSELARSPVTRSVSRNQTDSRKRRSSRVRNIPRVESPQVALRHKLKQKLHESTTQSPLPPSKRPRSQSRAVKTPAVASPSLYDEDITPRGLLRGIIQTEAEASLLLSGQPAVSEANQQLTETSIYSNRQSEGPSGLELPDLVTEPLSNVIRGMSRRRPPPTFNVSAFERQLDLQTGERAESDVTEQNSDVTEEQDMSAGSKSVLSLTLKTPFVNIQSERAGLRRKAASRSQPSVDAFDEAVQKRLERHCNQDYTVVQEGKTFGDSDWQKFTLGLSNVTVPDLTTDIVMSNTELYPQPTVSVSELKEDDVGAPELDKHESEEAFEADRKTDDEVEGNHQEEVVVEDHQEEEVVGDYQEKEAVEDYQEGEIVEDHESESLSKNYETEPEPFKDMEEGEEVDMVYSSQEKEAVLLSPDDIPFAPTQAMAEPVLQTQEEERQESEIQEVEVEGIGWKESVKEDLPIVELPSQLLERITRRAYRSEGGTVMPVMTARGRATKSLGAGLYPTGKETQSFTNGSSPDELPSLEEEQSISPASPSISPSLRHSPSATHYTGLAEVKGDEVNGVTEGDISKLEEENIATSPVHQSLNSDSHAAEEEEKQEGEEKGDEEEEEDADAESEELSMQTPAFIRKRKEVATPRAMGTPTVLKVLNTGPAPKVVKPHAKPKNPTTSDVLPKSYVMSVFKHFAKTKVASDVYPVINEILQKYFDRLADDLEAYSAHAKRKTIEVEDVELLMRRQGFVTDSTPVNVLIERFLPLEYRKLLIPVASSGNKVIPN